MLRDNYADVITVSTRVQRLITGLTRPTDAARRQPTARLQWLKLGAGCNEDGVYEAVAGQPREVAGDERGLIAAT